MRKDYTHITILLDRSGSMEPVRDAVIEGLNGFLKTHQTLPGQCTLSLYQFDYAYESNYVMAPIGSVTPLSHATYQPRGSTALYDSLRRSIDETGAYLNGMREQDRPEKVIFVIQTDGYENASYN